MTRLIADIGGTNVRFGLVEDGHIDHIKAFRCAEFPSPSDAAHAYLDDVKIKPQNGAFAVACPIHSDKISMTNHVWTFSIDETRRTIGLETLRVINDFTALAYAAPYLQSSDLRKVGVGTAKPRAPIGVIGPGTGLGAAGIVFDDKGNPVPVTTEGGHMTMAASSPREYEMFEYLRQTKYHHISAERVCSGKGLVNLYHAICGIDGLELPELEPHEITKAALEKTCKTCEEVMDMFCHFLGVAAGNFALCYGAHGGIYIGGGVVPKLGSYFDNSRFREGFEFKGRFSDYMREIPTYVITNEYPGLLGLKYVT